MDGVINFCGFNLSSPSFIGRYFFNKSTSTLTPCAELAVVALNHFPLIYFTVYTLLLFHFRLSPRIEITAVRNIIIFKCFVAGATAAVFGLIGAIGYFAKYSLLLPYMVEYGFIIFAWVLYFVLWVVSLFCASWTNTNGLFVGSVFAFLSIALIAAQRWILYGVSDMNTICSLTVLALHLVGAFVSVLEWRIKSYCSYTNLTGGDDVTDDGYVVLADGGDENAGFLSRIFFCWTNDLIHKGYKLQLNQISDLFVLPKSLDTEGLEKEFFENAPTIYVDAEEFSLTKTLLKAFGVSFFSLGLLRLFADMLVFAGPILLHLLVVCLANDDCVEEGYVYCILMMLASFFSAILSTNFNYLITIMGLKVKSVLSSTIYDKLLNIRLSTLSKFSSGQILNFMSSDTDRIVGFCNSFHAFWSMPLQLGVALYLLYREVGLAFLSGLAAAIILVPLNKWLTSKIGQLSSKMMRYKDERAKLISETVRSIRAVKLSNWEEIMHVKINKLRDKELRYLRGRKYLDAICVYLWASAPILITIMIFFTFTFIMRENLTAAKVFTSLSLVNILIVPLNAFPWVLSSIVEAFVSVKRLNAFFALKNIDLASLYSLTTDPCEPLQLDYATFSWPGGTSVKNATFRGKIGSVIGLVGPVGSGKTTFLLGILGETESGKRRIRIKQETVRKGFAYVSQDCWLKRGTVMENVICGADIDMDRYKEVIAATALEQDLAVMPGGDTYEIGDGGCLLSGGQRARVALARALYQDRDIYLLDDPFASLDFEVGKFVWNEVVIKLLRGRRKLVVVASHRIEYLKDVDEVLVLDSIGNIVRQGPPSIILPSASGVNLASEAEEKILEETEAFEQMGVIPEEKQQGKVRLSVYRCYAIATGITLTTSIFVSLIAMQGSKNISDWWLSKWVAAFPSNASVQYDGNDSLHAFSNKKIYDVEYPFGSRFSNFIAYEEWNTTLYYLTVYASLALANTIFTFFRAFLFAFGGVSAARNLHNRLLDRILHASISWWESTPAGRVINRLCADVYLLDDSLPFQFNIFLASSFNLIGSILIILLALPLLAPFIIILFVVYYLIQRYYRFTTCDVKRLTSMSLSPYYSHLTDTIAGLSTIRAFRFTEDFARTLRSRLTDIIRAQFSALATTQWLSIRLQTLGVFILSAVVFAAMLQRQLNFVNPGMVGLAITYALSVTNLLNTLLTSFVETEKELISVERIEDYATNAVLEINDSPVPILGKNVKGCIHFASVSLRYGPGLPLALDNVSFHIEAGTKVAIIGRTGSGKSSLFHVLLRAYDIESGNIYLDGIDIYSVELRSLRSLFGIVTQTPFVFSGTLRENLMLDCLSSNVELNKILEMEELKELVEKLGGLDVTISEGGANLSFGEKQIISICRLLLSRPKVVLFDEATAHLDSETHSRMNFLIRSLLPSATIIALLHRLDGIEEYDFVLKMEAGKLVRGGRPSEFLI